MNNEFPVEDDPSKWPICFVVSPIGNPGTPGRHRADLFLKFIVEPVLAELRYRPLRADMIAAGGLVTSQIVRHLVEAPLVIADLTDHNPNVMYELAIRHAAQKPFVQLIDKNQTIPFDVGQQRTIFFDITDLLSVDNCKNDLKRHIEEATKPGADPVETPVRRLIEIGNLSAGSKDDAIAQLAAKIDSLAARLPNRLDRVADMVIGEGLVGHDIDLPEAWFRSSSAGKVLRALSGKTRIVIDPDRPQPTGPTGPTGANGPGSRGNQ